MLCSKEREDIKINETSATAWKKSEVTSRYPKKIYFNEKARIVKN